MKFTALALLFALLAPLGRAGPPPAPVEAGQFDFWLGEWEVTTPDGKRAGQSRVEKIAGGWGVLENWEGAAGGSGKSLNSWRTDKREWQQFWVGVGGVLELAGGVDEHGAMVLRGTSRGAGGAETQEKITWTPAPDGSVRQLWEQSTDRGATWVVSFDGRYRRTQR